MPYTQLVVVPALDLTPEELDLGDRLEFLTKMNSQMTKLQAWAALFETSVNSINAMGAELEATQLDDAAAIAGKLNLTGGTLTGNVTVEKATPSLYLTPNTATDAFIYFGNNTVTDAAFIKYDQSSTFWQLTLSKEVSGELTDTNFRMYGSYFSFDTEARGVDATTSTGLVTKSQMESAALLKTGGTMTGQLTVDADAYVSRSDEPAIVGMIYPETQHGVVVFRSNSVAAPTTYVDDAYIYGTTDYLLLRNRVDGTTNNDFHIRNTYSEFSNEVRGVDATNSAGLVTKSQMESAALLQTGGTVTGSITADGSIVSNNALFVNKSGSSATVHIDALDTQYSNVNMKHAGVIKGAVATDTTRLLLNYKGGTSDNFLSIYDTYSSFINEVRGVASTNSAGFVTKSQMESEAVNLTGTQTIGGSKTFEANVTISKSAPWINILPTDITDSEIRFGNGTVNSAGRVLYDASTNTMVVQNMTAATGASTHGLNIRDTYSDFTKEVRGVVATSSDGFVTKAQMDAAIADAIAAIP